MHTSHGDGRQPLPIADSSTSSESASLPMLSLKPQEPRAAGRVDLEQERLHVASLPSGNLNDSGGQVSPPPGFSAQTTPTYQVRLPTDAIFGSNANVVSGHSRADGMDDSVGPELWAQGGDEDSFSGFQPPPASELQQERQSTEHVSLPQNQVYSVKSRGPAAMGGNVHQANARQAAMPTGPSLPQQMRGAPTQQQAHEQTMSSNMGDVSMSQIYDGTDGKEQTMPVVARNTQQVAQQQHFLQQQQNQLLDNQHPESPMHAFEAGAQADSRAGMAPHPRAAHQRSPKHAKTAPAPATWHVQDALGWGMADVVADAVVTKQFKRHFGMSDSGHSSKGAKLADVVASASGRAGVGDPGKESKASKSALAALLFDDDPDGDPEERQKRQSSALSILSAELKDRSLQEELSEALKAAISGAEGDEQADEIKAQMTLAAMLREPHLVTELDSLAASLSSLHKLTVDASSGLAHLSFSDLRRRLESLNSRSVPMLRRVCSRYRSTNARWKAMMEEVLRVHGLSAADASMLCCLCGSDKRIDHYQQRSIPSQLSPIKMQQQQHEGNMQQTHRAQTALGPHGTRGHLQYQRTGTAGMGRSRGGVLAEAARSRHHHRPMTVAAVSSIKSRSRGAPW